MEAQRKREEMKERRRREAEEAERLCREAEAANQQRREAEEAERRRRDAEAATEKKRKLAEAEAAAAEKKRKLAEAEAAAAEKRRQLEQVEEARRRKEAEDRRRREKEKEIEDSKRNKVEAQEAERKQKEAQDAERHRRRDAEEKDRRRRLEAEKAKAATDKPVRAREASAAHEVESATASSSQPGTLAPAAAQTHRKALQPTSIDLVASFVVQNHIDWAAEAVLLALPEALRTSVVADGPCASPDPSGTLLDRIQARRAGAIATPSVATQGSLSSSGTLKMQPLVAKFFADNPVDSQTQELFARQSSDVQFKVIHQGRLSGPNPSAMLVERIANVVPSAPSPPDAISEFIARAGLDASCEKVMRSLEQGLAQQVMAEGPLHGNRLAAALSGRIRRLRNALATTQAQATGYASGMQAAMPATQCAGQAFGQYVQAGVY